MRKPVGSLGVGDRFRIFVLEFAVDSAGR